MKLPLPITVLALCCAAAFAEKSTKTGITPVQAELSSDLATRILKVGSTVYARVSVDWQGSNCALSTGAVLEAHVLLVVPHTKTVKDSQLGLAFTGAQCGGMKLGSFPMVLAAMAAPPGDDDYGIMSASLPVLTTGAGGIAAIKSGAVANWTMQSDFYRYPLIPSLKMGEVSGIKGLTLSVGAGPEHSSILTSRNRDVSLDKRTMLMLVPAPGLHSAFRNRSVRKHHGAPSRRSTRLGQWRRRLNSGPGPVAGDIDLCVPPPVQPGVAVERGHQ